MPGEVGSRADYSITVYVVALLLERSTVVGGYTENLLDKASTGSFARSLASSSYYSNHHQTFLVPRLPVSKKQHRHLLFLVCISSQEVLGGIGNMILLVSQQDETRPRNKGCPNEQPATLEDAALLVAGPATKLVGRRIGSTASCWQQARTHEE